MPNSTDIRSSVNDSLPRPNAMRHLVIAALITAALYFVPYLGWVTYPLRLLVTFIHEGSHALMTLLTGGSVHSLIIRPDASGVTLSLGGFLPLIASAGYLGATLYGALMIAALRRGIGGRAMLLLTGVIIGLITVGFVRPWPVSEVANFPLSIGAGIGIAVALIAGGLRLPERVAGQIAAFVGVQCILNALFDLRTLFDLSVMSNTATDAQNMAQMTLIPAVVWAVLWLGIAAAMLFVVVLRPAFRDARAAVIG